MKKRDILVLGIVILSIADIIITSILINQTSYTIEGNPIMRYMMSHGSWAWVLFKSTITMACILAIYKFDKKFRLRVIALINAILALIVINNSIILIMMHTNHADLF